MKIDGKCLCGKVRFIAEAESGGGMCHCKMCRRWCGGLPFAEVNAEVLLKSEETLRWWKSSPWGERGFCGECGSSLFWRSPGDKQWGVSIGALEDESGLKLTRHIYIDDASPFYNFSDEAPRLTSAECTARMMGEMSMRYGDDFIKDVLMKIRAHSGDGFADEVEQLMKSGKRD